MDYREFLKLADTALIDDSLVIDVPDATLDGVKVKGEIRILADRAVIRRCSADTITVCGAANVLIAQSTSDGIKMSDCFNCSVVLNETNSLSVKDSRNVYVIDNKG